MIFSRGSKFFVRGVYVNIYILLPNRAWKITWTFLTNFGLVLKLAFVSSADDYTVIDSSHAKLMSISH